MSVRVCAFVIWAMVAASAVFWGLRLFVRAADAPSHAVPVGGVVAVRGDLSRLLGAAPVATLAAPVASPEVTSRFRLVGVMAPRKSSKATPSGQGVALIAVDGKPPKAYAVGARLDTDLVLQTVSLRSASIGPAQGSPTVKLEIPPLPAPATGTLSTGIGAATVNPPTVPVAVPPVPNFAAPVIAVPQPPPPSAMPQLPSAPADPSAPPSSPGSRRDFGASSR